MDTVWLLTGGGGVMVTYLGMNKIAHLFHTHHTGVFAPRMNSILTTRRALYRASVLCFAQALRSCCRSSKVFELGANLRQEETHGSSSPDPGNVPTCFRDGDVPTCFRVYITNLRTKCTSLPGEYLAAPQELLLI